MQQSNNSKEQLQPPIAPLYAFQQGFFLDKEESMFSGVTPLVKDSLVYAHSTVLVARSSVFAALLSDDLREGFCNPLFPLSYFIVFMSWNSRNIQYLKGAIALCSSNLTCQHSLTDDSRCVAIFTRVILPLTST